jgi:hypothetical protein
VGRPGAPHVAFTCGFRGPNTRQQFQYNGHPPSLLNAEAVYLALTIRCTSDRKICLG